MAFNDIERTQVESAVAEYVRTHRPPAEIRDQVDLSFRVTDQSVELFEIRPRWDDHTKKVEESVAKARNTWLVYWQRADLKWHKYEPHPEVRTIHAFLKLVEEDKYCCFFG